eukprot:6192353-Pleurochrysis_carterae.AAC.3
MTSKNARSTSSHSVCSSETQTLSTNRAPRCTYGSARRAAWTRRWTRDSAVLTPTPCDASSREMPSTLGAASAVAWPACRQKCAHEAHASSGDALAASALVSADAHGCAASAEGVSTAASVAADGSAPTADCVFFTAAVSCTGVRTAACALLGAEGWPAGFCLCSRMAARSCESSRSESASMAASISLRTGSVRCSSTKCSPKGSAGRVSMHWRQHLQGKRQRCAQEENADSAFIARLKLTMRAHEN